MAINYYIKAYFTKSNQHQEIRRFAIDISPNNDAYNELKTKITSYLLDSQLKDFILQYNDEENEHITFSSNDELRSAIDLNKDTTTLKVFVIFKEPTVEQQQQQQQQQQQGSSDKDCHVGVRCDNCKGSVVGFRYKCFVCPDYDLCEKCSSAGAHQEHNMIRITKPSSFQPLDEHYHRHFYEHHNRHSHFTPPPPPPFVPSKEYLQKLQSQIPHWLPNAQHAAHLRTHVQQHIDALRSKSQKPVLTSKEYLESVGQYLQKVLTPLGVDCEYHVDEEKPTTQQQQQQQQQEQHQQEQEPQQHSTSTDSIVFTSNTSVASSTSESTEINNTQEQCASSTTPIVEESAKIRDPLEHAIDDCMERMIAMGFMDASGALRELIRSKKGDINAVLDAINPRFSP